MADWTSSMQQTFEYYIVDPGTWKDKELITTVLSCSIDRDLTSDTLGSASIDIGEAVGECYIRAYLITIQNGVREKHALGTFLVQTPSLSYNGKMKDVTMDAYTPLLELKENNPPIGYYLAKRENVMRYASQLASENARAPVVFDHVDATTLFSNFVSNADDNWLSFIRDLASYAKYELALDEMGRILFAPQQDTASLRPIWTYSDNNSSILHADIGIQHDLYGIPNVVEVLYSDSKASYHYRVVNDDPNSPTSTVNRGREIIKRETNPSLIGDPTEGRIREYAEQLLRDASTLEYTVTYTHGYCPVRVGDCVLLDCARIGLDHVKAKVIRQSISCEPGCPVSETAIITTKLWGDPL